ncbi:MAG: SDR family oxidoreductase [Bacteroidota bacterium]
MDIQLKGKNALVCGSSQGIGKATAIELASLGANVCLFARNQDSLTQVKASLDSSQGQIHEILVGDFSKPDEVQSIVAEHIAEQGKVFHILVNNTGGPAGGPILAAEPNAFLQAYQQHLVCNHLLAQAVIPGMTNEAYGRIINVISISVKIPIAGLGVSNTTRGAVASWAKTLAAEVAPFGITVNNVLPGFTDTERLRSIVRSRAEKAGVSYEEMEETMIRSVPARRFGEASETAAAIAFLASPAAAFINGVNLAVDGGQTPSM